MAAGKEWRRWMVLVSAIWIQAFTGTNFDFPAYSSHLKSVLDVSQVELNYLAVASDLGKAFGWSSGLAILYFPLWAVLLAAASVGFVGYGLQWLLLNGAISLPYFSVFGLCLVCGCSICWFNTVCFVVCIRSFTDHNRPLALSLTVAFNGVSAALFNLAADSFPSSTTSQSHYLLLNSLLPLLISLASLPSLFLSPSSSDAQVPPRRHDSFLFALLYILALATGVYLLYTTSFHTATPSVSAVLFTVALLLLATPLVVPIVVASADAAIDDLNDDQQLDKKLLGEDDDEVEKLYYSDDDEGRKGWWGVGDGLRVVGEEHTAKMLVKRVEFWLYFVAYFCGGTLGIVYSNNLGQIAQSLGAAGKTDTLLTLFSAFSFFGRLLSAVPDFLRGQVYFARTGWLAIALAPMPVAFFFLSILSDGVALQASTAVIGLSSGFIFAAAVSVTSELFGPNNFGVNHNILVTNIPIGSMLYGSLAALIYDANGIWVVNGNAMLEKTIVCMGTKCYKQTFLWWACICAVGLVSSLLLFLRTKLAYKRYDVNRNRSHLLS